MGLDEWGFSQETSKIVECKIQLPDGKFVDGALVSSKYSKLQFQSGEVSVNPDQLVRFFAKSSEIKRDNDNVFFHFTTPTTNPEIEVIVPEGFGYQIGFGPYDASVQSDRYSKRHTLDGTYFPGQGMRVRWYPRTPT